MPFQNICENLPIYYEDHGDGVPILFIPPPGMGHVVFKYQKHLAQDFRVIIYDIRGQGNSGNYGEDLTIPLLAEDINLLLEAIGINEVVLCGYSAGGSIALDFALNYPKKTKALILSGGYPEVSTFLLKKEYKIGIRMVEKNPNMLAKILAKSHRVTKEDERDLFDLMTKNRQQSWKQNYEESLQYKCTDQLHQLKMPVLLLYGQLSFYLKGYRKFFLDRVENVQVGFIKGAFHQVPMKHYQIFNKRITEFLLGEL